MARIDHIFLMAGSSWERAKDLAHEALEDAERRWRTVHPERLPSKTGENDIRVALNDGFDLIDMALRYLEGKGT